jgi:superfamily II DNA or RNA helicase
MKGGIPMITIELGNVTSRINNLTGDIPYYIADELSYQLKGFGVDKDTKYLYKPMTNATYTGLIPHAIKVLKELNLTYQIIDRRVAPVANANFKIADGFSPRDYQAEIINRASSREIIQAATGAGKTYIMAELIAKFNVFPVIVVAPKVSLAVQLQEELSKFLGEKVGIITGEKHNIQKVTVGTPQSLISANIVDKAKAILFDETHFLPAQTIFEVACKAINAYYRIGVSATPWRDAGDDLLIEAALNVRKPHLNINASKLIAKGKLVPCTINFIDVPNQCGWLGSYSATYNSAIMHNIYRNKMIADLAMNSLGMRKSVLILISKIEHGEILCNMLKQGLGLRRKTYYVEGRPFDVGNVEFVSGCDDLSRRQAVFQAVEDGWCKIMIGSTIADEGLDLPILDTLILAGAGKSSTRAFQRIGRVLRLYEGKRDAVVYDFMDSNETFNKQAAVRHALYQTESLWKINMLSKIAA